MAELNLPEDFLADLEFRPCTQYWAPWYNCEHVYRDTWVFHCMKSSNGQPCKCANAPNKERCNVTYAGREGFVELQKDGTWEDRCETCRDQAAGKAKITEEMFKKWQQEWKEAEDEKEKRKALSMIEDEMAKMDLRR